MSEIEERVQIRQILMDNKQQLVATTFITIDGETHEFQGIGSTPIQAILDLTVLLTSLLQKVADGDGDEE